MSAYPPALLALADGTVFHGKGIGAVGSTVGEVVFNTSMSGYQEILTDPSYSRQIVTLTYPHIGNTGVNLEDVEATRAHAAGLVIRDLPILPSNFRMSQRLDAYLRAENVVAIAGLDTRKLTRILREKGAQAGCIVTAAEGEKLDAEAAVTQARAFPGLAGMDLAKVVSVTEPYEWKQAEWKLGEGYTEQIAPSLPCRRLRLRRQAQHPAHAGRARLPPDRGAGADARLRGAGAQSRRRVPVQRPG